MPAAHWATHAEAPAAREVNPAAHELHAVAPVLAWQLPATHAVQGVPVPAAAVPTVQLTHAA